MKQTVFQLRDFLILSALALAAALFVVFSTPSPIYAYTASSAEEVSEASEDITSLSLRYDVVKKLDLSAYTSLTSIAFYGKVSAKIIFPAGVKKICYYGGLTYFPSFSCETSDTFANLTKVVITSCDGIMPNKAFYQCTKLKDLTLPNTITRISASAFYHTRLSAVNFTDGEAVTTAFPGTLTVIGSYAFYNCRNITSLDFSAATISEIPADAFAGCENLAEVRLPQGLTKIGNYAFYDTGLTQLAVPATVTTIGEKAFCNCKALSILTLSKGLETLGESAFRGTALTSLTLPSTLKTYGKLIVAEVTTLTSLSFHGNVGSPLYLETCTALQKLTISGTLSVILDLRNDTSLTSILVKGKVTANPLLPPSIEKVYYKGGVSDFPCFNNLLTTYDRSTGEWVHPYDHLARIYLASADTPMPAYAFAGCNALTYLRLPNNTTNIGAYAFQGRNITTYYLAERFSEIGEGAFADCSRLYQVRVKNPNVSFGKNAFSGCAGGLTVVADKGSATMASAVAAGIPVTTTKKLKIVRQTGGLLIGESTQIAVYNNPGSATFTSSDPSILTVNEKGLVTGIAAGRAKVTVNANGTTKIYDFACKNKTTERVLNRILKNVVTSDMTVEEKVKAMDAWLCAHVAYDYEGYMNNSIAETSYTAEGALVKGLAVSEGYAQAMKLVLDAYGIENEIYILKRDNLTHTLNRVKIDGKWCYVDSSWDDPVVNGSTANTLSTGRYLLVTRARLIKRYDWTVKKYELKSQASSVRTIKKVKASYSGIQYEGDPVSGNLIVTYDDTSSETITYADVSLKGDGILAYGKNKITFVYRNQELSVTIRGFHKTKARLARTTYAEEYKNAQYRYSSDNTYVAMNRITTDTATYLLAHVIVSDVSQLHNGLSGDTYGGTRETPSSAAVRLNWVIGTNGSYFYYDTGKPALAGIFVKDGMVYEGEKTKGKEMALTSDGLLFTPTRGMTADELMAAGVTNTWGTDLPLLIEDGNKCAVPMGAYPRTAWGMVSPGEYYILVAGENNYAKGMSLQEVRDVLYDKGCTYALCLDGGGSSALVFEGELINSPAAGSERPIADFLYITD